MRRCAAGPARCCSPAPPARWTTRSVTWRYSGAWRRVASPRDSWRRTSLATVLIAPIAVVLDAPAGARVSLAPAGAVATVTLTGLDYPLERGALPADACLGLGNHVTTDGDACIELHEGTIVVLVGWAGETFRSRPAERGA